MGVQVNTRQTFRLNSNYFSMKQVVYDGSFAGLLTAIFEVYEYKFNDVQLYREMDFSPGLCAEPHMPSTKYCNRRSRNNDSSVTLNPSSGRAGYL